MKSSIAREVLDNIPVENRIFANKYADMVVLINSILKAKGLSQKRLAEDLDKKPAEINRWLKSGKNLTLMTICKLEAVLGCDIFSIPTPKILNSDGKIMSVVVHKNIVPSLNDDAFTKKATSPFENADGKRIPIAI